MNQKNRSTWKIVCALIAIAILIFTVFFAYHLQNKQQPLLATNDVTLFNVGRSLKKFDLIKENNTLFSQQNLKDHWTLLYFGFTHCPHICPTTSLALKEVYQELKDQYPTLQVVLVTVDPNRDTPEVLSDYLKHFHRDFIGVTGKEMAIRQLQSQLGIYSEKEDSEDANQYQMQHTSSILLFNPKGQWVGSIRYGLNKEELIAAVKQSIEILRG